MVKRLNKGFCTAIKYTIVAGKLTGCKNPAQSFARTLKTSVFPFKKGLQLHRSFAPAP